MNTYCRSKKTGRPRRFETAEEFEEASYRYLSDCERRKTPPTFPGWAASMRISGRALRNYGTRPEFAEVYACQKTRIEAALAEKLFAPGAPVTGILAALNSGFGWRDPPPNDFPAESQNPDDEAEAERLVADLIAKAQAFGESVP